MEPLDRNGDDVGYHILIYGGKSGMASTLIVEQYINNPWYRPEPLEYRSDYLVNVQAEDQYGALSVN